MRRKEESFVYFWSLSHIWHSKYFSTHLTQRETLEENRLCGIEKTHIWWSMCLEEADGLCLVEAL